MPARFAEETWASLDTVDLRQHLLTKVGTAQNIPHIFKGRFRAVMITALERLSTAYTREGGTLDQERAWKLFILCPRMLLRRCAAKGAEGKAELLRRFRLFEEGAWQQLAEEASASAVWAQRRPLSAAEEKEMRISAACASIRQGEISRGRQRLVGDALAPGNAETLAELRDPAKRPPAPLVPLPQHIRDFEPTQPLRLDKKLFLANLRAAPRGSASGQSGMRFEHLRELLNDETASDLYCAVAEKYAQGNIPPSINDALTVGGLTAQRKDNGKIRGIVAGDVVRRHIGRTLAQQFSQEIEGACAPFQYALSTRAGTDCVGHALRAGTDIDSRLTVVSIDGVGAFDHIYRSAMLSQLQQLPRASAMLPFVRLAYGQTSTYVWRDAQGASHTIHQGEGGEQGDALMPPLYALGQHRALTEANQHLEPGEALFAYLDDVYLLCQPERATFLFNIIAGSLERHAGVQANLGKCKMWNREGVEPPGVRSLGDSVWVGGSTGHRRSEVSWFWAHQSARQNTQ